jgi:hypothetical protein
VVAEVAFRASDVFVTVNMFSTARLLRALVDEVDVEARFVTNFFES